MFRIIIKGACMSITTKSLSQEEPVHFRVAGVQPNPISPHPTSNEIVLTIEYVNKPETLHIGMRTEQYVPHRDMLQDAIKSQAVYWVDWDYSKTPNWPPRRNDSTLDRLFRAIADRQIVNTETNAEEP